MLKWLQALINVFKAKSGPVAERGRAAAAEAERLWKQDVYDPKVGDKRPRTPFCLRIITEIITRTGWGWSLTGGQYKGDGPPQWCGLFAAYCWLVAGLDPKWVATFWASTLRLDNWVKDEGWKPEGKPLIPSGGKRPFIALNSKSKPTDCVFPDGSLPQAGDILVVGDETPKDGDHINIVMSFDPVTGAFDTISGNGGGVGPNGDSRQGISRRTYTIGTPGYHPLRVYRPMVTDLLSK